MSTPAVAILVPVLNRPHRVAPLVENIEAVTPEPHRILFLATFGDDAEIAALENAMVSYANESAAAEYLVCDPERATWPCKINIGFEQTTEPFVFLGADDLRFRRHWLDMLFEAWSEYDDPDRVLGVIGTNDLCNDRTMRGIHSTHSLVNRRYIETEGGTATDGPGVVLHEGYQHDYADDELVEVAKSRGAYAHAILSGVEHLHPLCGKAPMDETYALGQRIGPKEGRRLFHRRQHLWDSSVTGRMARLEGVPSRKSRRAR